MHRELGVQRCMTGHVKHITGPDGSLDAYTLHPSLQYDV